MACVELVGCSCSRNSTEFWVLVRPIGGGFAVYALTCTLCLVWLLVRSFAVGSTRFLAAVFHEVCAQPSSSCRPVFAVAVIIVLDSTFLFLIVWPINISHRIDNSLIHYCLSPLLYLLGLLGLLVFPCRSFNRLFRKLGSHHGLVVNVAFLGVGRSKLASLESSIIAKRSTIWGCPQSCATVTCH